MRSRAFLLAPATLPVDDASRFGVVTRMFKSWKDHAVPTHPDFADDVIERLRELKFAPDTDYVILTGQTLAMITLMATVVAEYGEIKTLVYDRAANRYHAVNMGVQLNEV
jgi:hypothetical protein